MSAIRRGTMAAAICAAALALSGCGAPGHGADTEHKAGKTASWSEEIKRSAAKARNSLVKGILQDGTITDEEFQEFVTEYNGCLQPHGMTATFDADGTGESVTNSTGTMTKEQGDDGIAQCQASTDYMLVVPVYQQMRKNPDHRDPAGLVLACLKRKGLADPSMTRQDYIDVVTDENRNAKTFGRYEDPDAPGYDAAKARDFADCQTNYR